jgi:hypothetical protein
MTRRPLVLRTLAVVVAALALVGIGFAWQLQKQLTARSGEDALRHFAPQNTAIAATFDLHPSSMEQVQVAQRIQTALKNERLDTEFQPFFRKLTREAHLVREILPFLTGSGAILLWAKSDSDSAFQESPDALVVAGVARESEVIALLKRHATRTSNQDGQTLYHVRLSESSDKVAVTLRDNYLLIGELPSLKQAFDVRSGKTKSLKDSADFTRLRKMLPGDANLLCFVSADFVRQAGKHSGHNDKATTELLHQAQAACTSVTLRKDGIAFDSVVGGDAEYLKPIIESASIEPTTAQRIPSGALGLCILAQPAKYIEAFEQVVDSAGGETSRSWDKGLADFERESDIRLHEDILPALNGHLILAAYPGAKQDSLDLLILADTDNKANPAQLADQARDFITEKDRNLSFTSKERNNATFWTLPESWKVDSLRSNASSQEHSDGERVAQVDNALVFATSSALLDDAVSAYRGQQKVSPDVLRFPAESKAVFVLQPTRILKMVSTRMEELQAERPEQDRIRTEDLLDLFGSSPLIASAGYRDRFFTGSLFVPFHYETAAKFMRRILDLTEKERNHDSTEEELAAHFQR